jgi:hypothetical protein
MSAGPLDAAVVVLGVGAFLGLAILLIWAAHKAAQAPENFRH